ncbi:MAG TPA: N-6 DNA methylase [Solirubrobacterales bacterium]
MSLHEAFARYRAMSRVAVQENLHHDKRRAQLQELLRDGFGVEADEVELERNVRFAEVRGRIDLLYRNLVFEVKRDLKREHEDVIRELHLYLSSLDNRAFAIAADGQRFEAYRLVSKEVVLVNELSLEEVDDETAIQWLDAFLFTQQAIAPTAESVVRRFGPHSPVFLSAEDELGEMWDEAKQKLTAETKRAEWDRLLGIVYGSSKGSDSLFLRHTYLAIVSRLFAFLAIKQAPPASNEVTEVITGRAFHRLGIENLVEEDFFGWISEPGIETKARRLGQGIARHLSVYATELVDEDLLKQLYETLVDPDDRHDLGEFYTPDWLAAVVLREANYGPGQRLLDPACGSGTFLFLAVRVLRESGLQGQALVTEAEQHLVGFDVHPLAVTVARANFVLALREDLQAAKSTVSIPIWMANSLAVPELRFGRPIEVPVPESPTGASERFTLPTEMEEVVPGSLAQTVGHVRELSEPSIDDKDADAALSTQLDDLGVGNFSDIWLANLRLFRKLVREGRDTIWGFVLSNAVRPQVVAQNPVDLVVGNPPWLALRDIADATYQGQLTELALEYGLLKERRGWQTGALELATIFACFSIDHYLKTEGKLAFVLPRGVLFGAKQHEPFRRLEVSPSFAPVKAFDLADVDPLFNVPSTALIIRKEGKPKEVHWPVQTVSGTLPTRNVSEHDACSSLSFSTAQELTASAQLESFYLQKALQGATLAPRPFWFIKAESGQTSDRPWCVTDEESIRKAKDPWKIISLEGQIESEFIFATVLAVYAFQLGPIKLCALPVATEKTLRLLSPQEVLRAGGSGFYKWLKAAEGLWEKHRKASVSQSVPLFQYLDNHKNLTRQRLGGTRLVYGSDGSHVRAVVVNPKPILESVVPKPRGIIYDMNTYWIDVRSESEAHYLAGLLNSDFVNDAIKSAQTQGAWGARHIHRRPFERVAIPEFESTNDDHKRLAEISRIAHDRFEAKTPARTRAKQLDPLEDLMPEMNSITAKVCGVL